MVESWILNQLQKKGLGEEIIPIDPEKQKLTTYKYPYEYVEQETAYEHIWPAERQLELYEHYGQKPKLWGQKAKEVTPPVTNSKDEHWSVDRSEPAHYNPVSAYVHMIKNTIMKRGKWRVRREKGAGVKDIWVVEELIPPGLQGLGHKERTIEHYCRGSGLL